MSPEDILKKCHEINDGTVWWGTSRGTGIPKKVSFEAAIKFAILAEREACAEIIEHTRQHLSINALSGALDHIKSQIESRGGTE